MMSTFIVDNHLVCEKVMKEIFGDGVSAEIYTEPSYKKSYISIKLELKETHSIAIIQDQIEKMIKQTPIFNDYIKIQNDVYQDKKRQIERLHDRINYLERFKTHYDLEFNLRHGPNQKTASQIAEEYKII